MKSVVIGCGRMGLRHIRALQELGYNLVGVCDLQSQSLENARKEYNLSDNIVFSNVPDLLKNTDAELVIVATTAPSHKEIVISCANAGVKFILCEKPLSISIKDCQEMIEVCEKLNVRLAVNHQMRFLDQYIIPKNYVSSREFGGITSIVVNAGNFGMAMNGIHYFEMARYMFDELPNKVTAWFDNAELPNPRGAQFKDKSGCVKILTASGKRLYLDASSDQGHGIIVNYIARYGQITVDELAGNIYCSHRNVEFLDLPTTRYGQPARVIEDKIKAVDIIESTKEVIKSLVGGDKYPSGKEGLHAIKLLVAAYISNENNHKQIDINNDQLPIDRVFPWA